MPAPGASQIEPPASGFLKGAGLQGEDIPGLAAAIANTTGQALTMFLSQAMVMPGIPVAADPITGSGASAGPGKLMPPPAGGPGASQLEGLASGLLQQNGIAGEAAPDLGKALAQGVDLALTQFAAQAMVSPGIPCPPGASAGPGRLM